MSRIVSKARQLRYTYQAQVGREVLLKEVAEQVGLTAAALSNIELGKNERVDFTTLRKLCDFYSKVLGRPVGVGEILEYDPNQRTPELVAA